MLFVSSTQMVLYPASTFHSSNQTCIFVLLNWEICKSQRNYQPIATANSPRRSVCPELNQHNLFDFFLFFLHLVYPQKTEADAFAIALNSLVRKRKKDSNCKLQCSHQGTRDTEDPICPIQTQSVCSVV